MSKKVITLTDTYLPNITNMAQIKDETQIVLQNLFDRFMNETNCNNLQTYSEALVEYRYIRNNWIVPNSRYIRYLDTSNPRNIILKKGGFVCDCNKYTFTLYDKKYGTYKIDKRNRIFFIKLVDDDYTRCNLATLLEK